MALIEREAALGVLEAWPQLLKKLGVTLSPQASDMLTDCIRAIRGVKAIDAAPVVHGRWTKSPDGYIHCSHCGRRRGAVQDRFCGRCGAQMDGGEEHEAD